MSVLWAERLVTVVGVYAAIGVLFGVWFVVRGVGRVDPVAREGSRGFRVLILPGVAALWPLFLWRLARGVDTPPDERNPHRDQAEGVAS